MFEHNNVQNEAILKLENIQNEAILRDFFNI